MLQRVLVLRREPGAAPFASDHRCVLSRRHSYCNRSNVTRKLKTPGGKLVLQYTAKKAKGPQTPVGDQGRIHGVRCPRYSACTPRGELLKSRTWRG